MSNKPSLPTIISIILLGIAVFFTFGKIKTIAQNSLFNRSLTKTIEYANKEDFAKSISFGKRALKYAPDAKAVLNTYFILSTSYYKIGNINKAEEYALKASESEPYQANILINTAGIALENNHPKISIDYINKALKLNLNNEEQLNSFIILSSAYQLTGNLPKAESYARKGLEINANVTHLWITLAKISWQKNNYREIIKNAENALKYSSSDKEKAISYYWISVGNYKRKNLKLAEEAARLAIALDPENGSPYITLGNIMLDKNDLPEARRMAEQAIKLEDKLPWAHNLMASILMNENRRTEAIEEINKAIALAPEEDTFKTNLGIISK